MLEIGRLQAALDHQQQLTHNATELHQRLATAEATRDSQQLEIIRLRTELEKRRKPWWRQLLSTFK